MTSVSELAHRFRRYAEIQDATESRRIGRPATNTWAEGFRQAADLIEAQAAEIARKDAALANTPAN